MTEAKHTPGPWYADKNGRIWRRPPSDLYENGVWVAGGKLIAFADKGWYGKYHEGYPVEANARLIAAAPEMLEALNLCRQHMYEHASNTPDNAFEKLCAAIAKATGN